MKKACMLAYTFYEGDNRVRRYAESLARQGYQVDVVALRKDGQTCFENQEGIRICRIQKRIRNEKNKLSYLLRILKFFIASSIFLTRQHIVHRYDLIHVHSVPDFEIFATLLAKTTGAKIILDIHDIVPEFYASKFNVSHDSLVFKALASIEKASIAFSDHVIIANHLWEKILTSRSVDKEKCTTMLNYPDPAIFYKRQKGIHHDKFVMLYPGTINWHQGLDIAVRAFAQVVKKTSEVEFHIYGDGPMRTDIEQLIQDLNLQGRVYLKGHLPMEKIAAAMAEADLGIVPKRNDSFGGSAFSTKIFEFMAMGVPVVVSATQIDRYYFNDSVVRFFEPENIDDLAWNIEDLVKNKMLREQLVSNAMTFVTNNMWDKKEKVYLSLVDNLIGERAG